MSEHDERRAGDSERAEAPIDASGPADGQGDGSEPAEAPIVADTPDPTAPRTIPATAASPADPAESTGDERVDQAISRLAELDAAPVHEHAAVVEAIHRSLQDTLAEDEG
ncbi:MAG TPA: hypothetical protein VFY84_06010 [Jiangellales bacterium]|nr:hypothetical protein [Jiangellales bacterium]